MIEKRTIVLDRIEPDYARAVVLLCSADGSAYWSASRDVDALARRMGLPDVFEVKGVRATLELVDGRWTLARLERP